MAIPVFEADLVAFIYEAGGATTLGYITFFCHLIPFKITGRREAYKIFLNLSIGKF